jgi:hypothetical protein
LFFHDFYFAAIVSRGHKNRIQSTSWILFVRVDAEAQNDSRREAQIVLRVAEEPGRSA